MRLLRSQKGVTLLEVLASVVILSFVVFSVSYLFSKSYENSYKEESKDMSVNLARTVLEELKQKLKTTDTSLPLPSPFEGQTIDLNGLRGTPPYTHASIYYPSVNDKQYEIKISSLPFEDKTYQLADANGKSFDFRLNRYFALIQVEVVHANPDNSHIIQSYMEKR